MSARGAWGAGLLREEGVPLAFRFISVGYLANGQEVTISLEAMRQHCRPERVEEVLDDLAMLCEDVLAGWGHGEPGHPSLRIIGGPSK